MDLAFTRRRQRQAFVLIAALLLIGFFCQVFALDRFADPVQAAGSPTHAGTEFCHGSLANCAGTVDIGSSLHAKLTPPVAPEPHRDLLDVAMSVPAGRSPAVADPPPQSI
jgi:hypothetical protein